MSDEKNEKLEFYLDNFGIKLEDIENIQVENCLNESFRKYKFTVKSKVHYKKRMKLYDSFYVYCMDWDYRKVDCILPKEFDVIIEEYDCSRDAKKLFRQLYDIEQKDEKLFFKQNTESLYEVSGDIDFNFKLNKIRWLVNTIEQFSGDEQNKRLIDRLYTFNNLIYIPNNISMMPVTGGLNNIKETHCMDRLDSFVYLLSLYYKGEKGLILNANGTAHANKKELEKYLDSFIGINTYCKEIYHIDDKLVDKLMISGREILDSVKKIEVYLDLAVEFWKQKEIFYIKSTEFEIRKQYEYMLNRKKEITNEIEN